MVSVVRPRNSPRRRRAGKPAMRPTSTATVAPMSIAQITGTPRALLTRADTNEPMPAKAACPSVMWPLKPVTTTIETKITLRASMDWA